MKNLIVILSVIVLNGQCLKVHCQPIVPAPYELSSDRMVDWQNAGLLSAD
ncbi:hypothetical protein JW835_09500 [bacterium]|nr:hypothetical protein [bacterium]